MGAKSTALSYSEDSMWQIWKHITLYPGIEEALKEG